MTDEERIANERAALVARACTGKVRYGRAAAHRVAEEMRTAGARMSCYRCPFADDGEAHFHVGHTMSVEGMEQLARVIRGLPTVEQPATVRVVERYSVGTRVALEDGELRFAVIESVSVDRSAPKPYRIRFDDGSDCFTDLRGSSWYAGAEAERLVAGRVRVDA